MLFHSRRRELARATAAAIVAAAVFAIWIVFEIGGPRVTLVFDDVSLTIITLAMTVPCVKAARSSRGRGRVAWWFLAASVASWGLGEAIWTLYEVGLGREVPYPSLADAGYIGSYPLAAVAIILLPSEQAIISRVRVALDGLLIAASVLFASWVLALGQVVHDGHATFADLLGVGYLLADVALLSVVLTSLQLSSRPRRSGVLLVAGLASLCLADTAFAYLTAMDSYSTGALSDIGWLTAFLLIGLAALHWRIEGDETPAITMRSRRWSLLLPTLPAAVVAALTPAADDPVLIAVGGMVFVLVVVRQAVIHHENEALASSLRTQVAEVRNREERFAYAAKATSDAIWDLDLATEELEWGEGLTTKFGHQRAMAGSLAWWRVHVHPLDRQRVNASLDGALARGDSSWTCEYRFLKADRTYASVIDRGYVVHDAGGAAVRMVGAMTDITERHRYEAELAYRAHHDTLTGLPNRLRLNEELDAALEPRRGAARTGVGVLFVDVDHFKLINDSYGHAAGDDVIVVLGSRLSGAVRPGDLVCRFAGDEFVVLCPGIGTEKDAAQVAGRILAVLDQPVSVQGRTLHVSASVGIAVGKPGEVTAADLLRLADTALYEAKAKGRSRYELFSDELKGKAEFQIDLLSDLRRAFEDDALELHYQPIVSLASGETVGAEALLRWKRDGEAIPPGDFVPLAEDSGLIVPLGAWVIKQALADASAWPTDTWVSVNVSPRQLSDDLVEVVTAALAASGQSSSRLCIEVTETANLEVGHVRSILMKLDAIGVRVAIDDFGTGHSSLTHLRELPVGAMKVDRTFVGGMTTCPSDEGIVAAVIALARGIGVRVIAEGVETEEQAAALLALGCEYGQGYLFAKPSPAAEFAGRDFGQAGWTGAISTTS